MSQMKVALLIGLILLTACSLAKQNDAGSQHDDTYVTVRIQQRHLGWVGRVPAKQLIDDSSLSVATYEVTQPEAVDSIHQWLRSRAPCPDTMSRSAAGHAVIILSSSYGRDTMVVSPNLAIRRFSDSSLVCGKFNDFMLYMLELAWSRSLKVVE